MDAQTATALRHVTAGRALWGAQWVGYADEAPTAASLDDGGEHWLFPLAPEHLTEGARVPQYCWSDDASVGWASFPYPDSLIVSAKPAIARSLLHDPTLDLVPVMDSDVLPRSAAD